MSDNIKRKPDWLRVKANSGNAEVYDMLRSLGLNTVCEEAACPNCGECFGKKTATFMILGRNCTRHCRFCNVSKGEPCIVDKKEPSNVASAVKLLKLRHVVITSVTRDDLPDGGAFHFADVIKAIRDGAEGNPPVIEVLIPDFKGNREALEKVIKAKPDIINHNVETVPRLYANVRPEAEYKRSLELIKRVSGSGIITKSGIMVGLGEKHEEVLEVFGDLVKNGCMLLTIGQYLAPSKAHYPVQQFIEPTVFEQYKKEGEDAGFKYVASGPLVRSSYMAETLYNAIKR